MMNIQELYNEVLFLLQKGFHIYRNTMICKDFVLISYAIDCYSTDHHPDLWRVLLRLFSEKKLIIYEDYFRDSFVFNHTTKERYISFKLDEAK